MKKILGRSVFRTSAGKLLLAMSLTMGGLTAFAVDTVYVTTFSGSTVTSCPPYCEISGSFSHLGSGDITAATGVPYRTKAVYAYAGTPSFSIQPTLNVSGAIYQIDYAHNVSATVASCSADIVYTLSTPDGDLTASCTNTPVFQRSYGGPVWNRIGYITNHPSITQPTITFTYVSGTVNNTGSGRIYIDAFRFTEVNPCTGVAPDVTVGAPLAANQAFVNVYGIDAGSTNITVYQDDNGSVTTIGQLTSGIVAGSNSVATSALVAGTSIKATQTKNGCTSSMPVSGPIVGSGANPQITAFLSVYTNSAFAGPVGANTTSGLVNNYILKATALSSGSQSAPVGGQTLAPGTCWQTVTFDNSTDSSIYPNNGLSAVGNNDPFIALDALVFAIDLNSPDSGPYDIYVDQIKNGDVVIEDFESYPVGSTNTFLAPNQATTPNPASTFLTGYNSATISTNNAFAGTKSLRIRWQFADASTIRWVRVVAGASTGKKNPQLDARKPITIRYLVTPVGQTNDTMHFPTIPAHRSTVLTGSTVTWNVAAAGTGPFNYQWSYMGSDIPGATTSTYTKSNVQLADSGTYAVNVTGSCSATNEAQLTVVDSVPVLGKTATSTNITLTWSGPFMLQSATNVVGPWSDVSTNQSVQQTINKTKFFRLAP